MKVRIKVIGFDADDTLWDNQPHFDAVIAEFTALLRPYCSETAAHEFIHRLQVENLPLYGFGAKSLTLSMTQAACRLSHYQIGAADIERIIRLGRKLLAMPVKLLDSAEDVVRRLKEKYTLILITKGDLLDQKRKLRESGLEKYFHHIEILCDKQVEDYRELFDRLRLQPEEFVMVGNSLKSDIIPVLELNAHAVYIPYPATWQHENVDNYDPNHQNFVQVDKLADLLPILR
ncbi:MAG: HAD family hydrolase [Victivallaceae bacterium]|nr:HAD family hydrolase [Victivallaceae bacterium]